PSRTFTLLPYTTLFRSQRASPGVAALAAAAALLVAGPARADIDPHFTFGFTDLDGDYTASGAGGQFRAVASALASGGPFDSAGEDRKSTRLNSSHVKIS